MIRRLVSRFWVFAGSSWTDAERDAEQQEVEALAANLEDRGVYQSGELPKGLSRIAARHRRRRLRIRGFAALSLVVAVSAFLTVYIDNRLVHAITLAAGSSATPVALYLGLRRE
jgi:hypothetical protein